MITDGLHVTIDEQVDDGEVYTTAVVFFGTVTKDGDDWRPDTGIMFDLQDPREDPTDALDAAIYINGDCPGRWAEFDNIGITIDNDTVREAVEEALTEHDAAKPKIAAAVDEELDKAFGREGKR